MISNLHTESGDQCDKKGSEYSDTENRRRRRQQKERVNGCRGYGDAVCPDVARDDRITVGQSYLRTVRDDACHDGRGADDLRHVSGRRRVDGVAVVRIAGNSGTHRPVEDVRRIGHLVIVDPVQKVSVRKLFHDRRLCRLLLQSCEREKTR